MLEQAYQNGRVSAAAYNGIMQKIGNATSGLTMDSVPAYWKDLEEVRQDVGNLLMSAHSPKRSVNEAIIRLLLD